MAPLNVVALVSGGKDSFFSILHCQANGHNIVALANLYPAQDVSGGQPDDLESFMYQTIGHNIIPLYSEALGLPLYRQEIIGEAVDRHKVYGGDHSNTDHADETESLVPLLRKVLSQHPQVNAISTGAILSDYQRTRVESVALRLGLTPLSYLWRWPVLPPQHPTSLLQDMAAVGLDARIIKVASGGLDESMLWQNVAEQRTINRLTRAAERFGSPGDGAALGEGGEFETLAISGPASLWKQDIVVNDEDIHTVPGEAGSASIKIATALVRPQPENVGILTQVRIPDIYDTRFETILQEILSNSVPEEGIRDLHDDQARLPALHNRTTPHDNIEDTPSLKNLTGVGETTADETRSIMVEATKLLHQAGLDTSHILQATIVLRDMADFAEMNQVYGSYFSEPNPAARITVSSKAALTKAGAGRVMISFQCSPRLREGLHVQSRSYWAPANIGPYSQAVKVNDTSNLPTNDPIYIAGQIPLVPASMQLIHSPLRTAEDDFAHQTVLALQHLVRIGDVMKVDHWHAAVAFVVVDTLPASQVCACVSEVWKLFQSENTTVTSVADEEDDNFDVWHLQNSATNRPWTHLQQKETETVQAIRGTKSKPPMYVIQMDALPRGANIEWVGFGRSRDHTELEESRLLADLLSVFSKQILLRYEP